MTFNEANFERGRREACFDSTTGMIETDNGIKLTVDDARELFNAGRFTDYNISFWRLATEFNFDVTACLQSYEDARQ